MVSDRNIFLDTEFLKNTEIQLALEKTVEGNPEKLGACLSFFHP